MRSIPKNTTLGNLNTGNPMESSNEVEVLYIKVIYDGATALEIDRFNDICVIDGVDYRAKVRANLGQ
ncbi:Phage tail tube protein FII [compost metagenome]